MISLDINSHNTFFLTLSCDNLYSGFTLTAYTLEIYSTNITQTFTITDISTHTTRYNEFNLTGSTITLPIGFYDYRVLFNGNIIEIGKCEIKGAPIIKLQDTTNDVRNILSDTR